MTERPVNNDINRVLESGVFVIIRIMLFCIRLYLYNYIFSFYDFYDIKKYIEKYIKNRYIKEEMGVLSVISQFFVAGCYQPMP
jgi:hypothetical protein